MLHAVLLPSGNELRIPATVALASSEDAAREDVQFWTRPSLLVRAVKVGRVGVISCVEVVVVGRAERRVSLQGRFEAGRPLRVLRTWQVIGSLGG